MYINLYNHIITYNVMNLWSDFANSIYQKHVPADFLMEPRCWTASGLCLGTPGPCAPLKTTGAALDAFFLRSSTLSLLPLRRRYLLRHPFLHRLRLRFVLHPFLLRFPGFHFLLL